MLKRLAKDFATCDLSVFLVLVTTALLLRTAPIFDGVALYAPDLFSTIRWWVFGLSVYLAFFSPRRCDDEGIAMGLGAALRLAALIYNPLVWVSMNRENWVQTDVALLVLF